MTFGSTTGLDGAGLEGLSWVGRETFSTESAGIDFEGSALFSIKVAWPCAGDELEDGLLPGSEGAWDATALFVPCAVVVDPEVVRFESLVERTGAEVVCSGPGRGKDGVDALGDDGCGRVCWMELSGATAERLERK